MIKCENCSNENEGKYASGRFCSSSCAKSFSTKNKRSLINSKLSKKLKGKKLSPNTYQKRYGKKINKSTTCKYCKNTISDKKKVCHVCRPFINNIKLFKKLEVFENSKNLLESNKRCINKLKELYFKEKLSAPDIRNKFNIQSNTLFFFFKKNNINLRSVSKAIKLGLIEGTRNLPDGNYKFHKGYHTTWNGNKVYFRSSYELRYCRYLDKQKIKYLMESLRIKYYDSQKDKERIAIPDFYLPDSNKIVEIKSNYSLDKLNMKDKEKEYKKLGYDFELIVM